MGDGIIARTWVGKGTRVRFERFTELLRAADRVMLAKARTMWCPIDAERHRPVAVSAEVRARFAVPVNFVTLVRPVASHAQEGELRMKSGAG